MVEETYRERGGKTPGLPGMGAVAGPGRVDVRFAEDNDGELYLLTKPDGVIRRIVGARATTAPAPAANERQRGSHASGRRGRNSDRQEPSAKSATRTARV